MVGLIDKIKFDINSDRLGPDCPFTHWQLFFKKSMKRLCKKNWPTLEMILKLDLFLILLIAQK